MPNSWTLRTIDEGEAVYLESVSADGCVVFVDASSEAVRMDWTAAVMLACYLRGGSDVEVWQIVEH